MKRKNSRRRGLLRLLPVVPALLAATWPPEAGAGPRLVPDSIHIGTFFSGASVHVSGEIPAGSRAIVEVIGKRIEEQLLRKAQHWEIWMSVGEIDIEEAPCLYFVLSSSPEEFSGLGADAEFGYSALNRQVDFTGDVQGMERSELIRQFIELKEDEKLYGQWPGALKVSGPPGDRAVVEGSFRIPSRVAPGDYLVRLSVVDHGRLLHSETTRLGIRMTGLPAFLDSLAGKHGALHGLFAVAIAVIFGFLVGLAFKKFQLKRA